MALHPFRTFRKHQKVIWGFLVVLCMITFVFMSGTGGRGDIFDRITQWVRSSKGGTPVTTLYGQTVSDRDLMDLRRQRTLAKQALTEAARLALGDVQRELQPLEQEQKNKLPNPKEPGFEDFIKKSKLEGEFQQLQQQYLSSAIGAQMVGKTDELLDFLVWRHQADKLGIQLTADDVDAELKRSTSGRTGLAAVAAELAKASRQPITDDQMREDVRKVLADEFRVDMAQEALLSYDPAPREPVSQFTQPTKQIPAPVTPYEFWNYYQKQRTALDVALVPLPVEVPSGPSAEGQVPNDILQAMFDRYKNEEPRPDQARPGFKVPRRIKVGWVKADPGSEAYQKAAGETAQAVRVALGLAAGGNATLTGLPVITDPYFLNEYYTLKITGRFDMAGLTQPGFPLSLYAARVHPENAATAVGEITAAAAQGTPFGALALYQAGLVQANTKDMEPLVKEEANNRVPFGVSLLLAGAGSGTLAPLQGTMTAAGLIAYGDKTTQSLPMAAVQDQVAGSVRAALTRELATGDLKAFQKEMESQRSRGGNAAAKIKAVEEWLPKGIKDYHLEASPPMKEARDQFEIAKAPALQPLEDALLREPGQTPAKAEEDMSAALLKEQGEYRPMVWPPSPAQFGQQPAPLEANSFLVWRTEENPARVPSLDEVKGEVEAAWRLSKARLATRDAAEKLKAELVKTGGDLPQIRDIAAKHSGDIELTGVAREVPETVAVATGHRYQPFHFPDTIRYPAKDWVEQLLDRLKTKGDAIVLADQPEKTFYVAVLLERHEPSIHNFYDIYRDAAVSFSRDQLLDQLVQERRTKYREEFLKALRVEAGADPTTGKFKLSEEYEKGQEQRRGGPGRGGDEEGDE